MSYNILNSLSSHPTIPRKLQPLPQHSASKTKSNKKLSYKDPKLNHRPFRDFMYVPGVTDIPLRRQSTKLGNLDYGTRKVLERHYGNKTKHINNEYILKLSNLLKIKDANYKNKRNNIANSTYRLNELGNFILTLRKKQEISDLTEGKPFPLEFKSKERPERMEESYESQFKYLDELIEDQGKEDSLAAERYKRKQVNFDFITNIDHKRQDSYETERRVDTLNKAEFGQTIFNIKKRIGMVFEKVREIRKKESKKRKSIVYHQKLIKKSKEEEFYQVNQ